MLSSMAELVGAVSGDRKMILKSSTVQKALSPTSSEPDANNSNNNNLTKPKTSEDQNSNIYTNPDIHLSVVRLQFQNFCTEHEKLCNFAARAYPKIRVSLRVPRGCH